MDSPVTTNSICQSCYDNNIETRLVSYTKDPENFMVCPYCKDIVDKRLMRHVNRNVNPLGWKGNGKVTFESANPSRSRSRRNKDSDVFNVNDYKLAGKIDSDLVYFANQGFIVAVNDSGNDGDDME